MARNIGSHVLGKAMQKEDADESRTHYLEKFMQKEQNSELFLEAVKKDAPLDKLFKVVLDCYRDQNLLMCPLLVEVVDPELMKFYGGKYLIQVWNDEGNMVF